MVNAIILLIGGVLLSLLGLFGTVQASTNISRWFLPTSAEVVADGSVLLLFLALLCGGIVMITAGNRKRKNIIRKQEHQRAMRKAGAEKHSSELDQLMIPSKSLAEASGKILTYLFLETSFLKEELQEISVTLNLLSGLFNNTRTVLDRRFTGGLTAEKYQTGLDSLRNAVLTRIDTQIYQLCAVNVDGLLRKSEQDEECRHSLNKLTAYINGTKNMLDKTVGLVSRLALEAIDCSEDVLEAETVRISELVKEINEYR